ncbi:hypothetical protein [Methylocaldum gracile]|jgi:hypothetical protein|uniref:hypothetical protein n=1 Tax=Methylocaldum sp. 0917 TaxID=2485163 RepID=UPI00105B41B3
MPINRLKENEKDVVYQCLVAALKGPFFPEWEFHTLFGIDRNTLAKIVEAWPYVDDTEEDVALAINNSMGNLAGYPHGKEGEWKKYISVSPDEVISILLRWKE